MDPRLGRPALSFTLNECGVETLDYFGVVLCQFARAGRGSGAAATAAARLHFGFGQDFARRAFLFALFKRHAPIFFPARQHFVFEFQRAASGFAQRTPFQVHDYGEPVSVPSSTPSRRNATEVTAPAVSLAVAVRVKFAGAVKE